MMPAWVCAWISAQGADPTTIRAAYLLLGVTDDEYAENVRRAVSPPTIRTSDGTS